ncbi:LysM peptidoglycan-binding domain-containing protein [Alkalicella caledoniensis]|uniref:LysM peptidoglycan-binding domain-containing protein n=1 Tax=Alkalicella caledoniensis TaxID=2731377 RepID=A0A7G9WCW2_ALKCA|nr:LysM peptidoglycan-binding domain-containing protein [Alkalicella caledoniensis]QNO16524.1 LysM peptidoglycan-binding domain-containing protein [Alkalicella caledoniensis]
MKKIIILILTTIILLMATIGVASSLEQKHNKQLVKTIQYIEITVEQGDTMWSISERYRNEIPQDTFISIIQQFNNMPHTVVRQGSTLKIPIL